jgi:hypothetical protein
VQRLVASRRGAQPLGDHCLDLVVVSVPQASFVVREIRRVQALAGLERDQALATGHVSIGDRKAHVIQRSVAVGARDQVIDQVLPASFCRIAKARCISNFPREKLRTGCSQ